MGLCYQALFVIICEMYIYRCNTSIDHMLVRNLFGIDDDDAYLFSGPQFQVQTVPFSFEILWCEPEIATLFDVR